LFFVHPSGGSVHWYADLARSLGPDQPFYGIQAKGVNGDEDIHTTIPDMAAYYIKAMRTIQPEGPYALGSWSMGVMVAFEMAQQLEEQGEKVALLALLDQGPHLPTSEPVDSAAYLVETFGKNISLSLEQLRRLTPDDQIAYVFNEARRVQWLLPDVTLSQFRHFVHILRTHTDAWRNYTARPYSGRITLFRAMEQPGDRSHERDLGWGPLAAGGVDVYDVPGDHLSMIHEPHVRTLAEQLAACLRQVEGKGNGQE
jgi:thioesterase domain-containing protein